MNSSCSWWYRLYYKYFYREKKEDDEVDDDDDRSASQLQERLVILVAAVTKKQTAIAFKNKLPPFKNKLPTSEVTKKLPDHRESELICAILPMKFLDFSDLKILVMWLSKSDSRSESVRKLILGL